MKTTLLELIQTPEQAAYAELRLQLERGRSLYIELATKKEKDNFDVAAERLERAKGEAELAMRTSSRGVGAASRRTLRALADQTAARDSWLYAVEQAGRHFDKMIQGPKLEIKR